MKRTILGGAEAGEPLLRQALQAIRDHQQAIDDRQPADVLKRLRIEADHLYQTVIDYQLYKAGSLDQAQH